MPQVPVCPELCPTSHPLRLESPIVEPSGFICMLWHCPAQQRCFMLISNGNDCNSENATEISLSME